MSDRLSYWPESNHCPAGFDCAFLNSCPSFVQPCLPGFFCGTYGDNVHRKYLDYQYAVWATRTVKNPKFTIEDAGALYALPGRYIQNICLPGFYCPDNSTMLPCGKGNWCPEKTVSPLKCDTLSACPTQFATYQVNFMNAVIMGSLTILVFAISFAMLIRQRFIEKRTRKQKPSFNYEDPTLAQSVPTKPEDVGKGMQSIAPKSGVGFGRGLEFTFNNLVVEAIRIVQLDDGNTRKEQFAILPGISGSILPGSVTCILGPTGCGKSTLLNMLRVGGQGSCTGSVDVKLFLGSASRIFNGNGADAGVDVESYKPSSPTAGEGGGELLKDNDTLKTRIGFVPQDEILDRALTVRELLLLNAQARRGRTNNSDDEHAADDAVTDVHTLIERVLSDLSIRHIGDTVIGGSRETQAAANVSGGQLKRVNIACELVALSHPAALLLDEPTGGLDASIAYDLVESLESIASTGITVIMALQQPRPEIFARMDRVILMLSGGHIIYDGPPGQASLYLQSKGFDQNPETSDADFCIDVLNGLITPEVVDEEEGGGGGGGRKRAPLKASGIISAGEHLDGLAKEWKHASFGRLAAAGSSTGSLSYLHNAAAAAASDSRPNNQQHTVASRRRTIPIGDADITAAAAAAVADIENSSSSCSNHKNTKAPAAPISAPSDNSAAATAAAAAAICSTYFSCNNNISRFLFLIWLNLKRALLVRFRAQSSLVVYAFIHVIMATALSSGFSIFIQGTYLNIFTPPPEYALEGYMPSIIKNYAHRNAEDLGFQQLLFFMSTALGCASSLAAVPLFSGQLELVRREASSGMSVVAYAVGRMTGDLFFTVWNATVFAGVWLLFGHAGAWYNWLAVIICTSFAASGIGHLCAVSSRAGSASFTAIIITYIFCVFSGVEPKLTQVAHLPVVNWIWYISFATWTAEATYHTWSEYLGDNGSIPDRGMVDLGAQSYGFSVRSIGHAVGSLLAIGFAFRILTVIVLVYKSKPRGYAKAQAPSVSII